MIATSQLVAAGRPVLWRYAIAHYLARGVRLLVIAAIVVAGLAAVTPVVLVAFGYQPSVVHAAAMRPALEVGDVVVNQSVSPATIHAGDIVTYLGPGPIRKALTERVVAVQPYGDAFVLTTKTDMATETQQLVVPGDKNVNRMAYRVPGLGTKAPLAWRVLAVLLAAVIVGRLVRRSVSRR